MKLENIKDTKFVVKIIFKYYKYLEDIEKQIPTELFGQDAEFLSELLSIMIDDVEKIIDEETYEGEQKEIKELEKIEDFDKQIEYEKKSKYIGRTEWIGDLLFDYAQGELNFDEVWQEYEKVLKEQKEK